MKVFRSTWLRVCLVLVLIASLVILVVAEVELNTPRQPTKNLGTKIGYRVITPKTSGDVLLNPGKGWVLYGLPSDHSASTMAYATVGYMRYDWSSVEPSEGVYNWSVIDDALNAWKAKGKLFAFGVMNANSSDWNVPYVTPQWVFSDGAANVQSTSFDEITGNSALQYVPVWDNPIFLQKVKDFVNALARRYDNNPNIAFVDVRSYGNWGEQHVYGIPSSIPLSAAGVQQHIQIYIDAFKRVQIIVPWGAPDLNSAYDWAVSNGVGMRRDGMMVDSNGSELTRANNKQPSVFEFYASYQWLVSNGYWSDATLRSDVNIGKPSYIGMGQWGNDADIMLASSQSLVHYLANKMGYYFVLASATIPSAISNNNATHISLSWSNKGITYLYESCMVAVALLDRYGNVVQRQWFTGSNPRAWAPGKTMQENATITFTGVRAGTYELAVGLFQNRSDHNPVYKIGNHNRTANGWYVLPGNVTVS